MKSNSWLPDAINYDDFCGIWEKYLSALYDCYEQDLVFSSNEIDDKPIYTDATFYFDGKEKSFWHIIVGFTGLKEIHDFNRSGKIPWVKPIMNSYGAARIKCWKNTRSRDGRSQEHLILALPDFSYLVILIIRKNYFQILTAYPVQHKSQREKQRKEYEKYKV